MINPQQTIISQYSDSPVLNQLLQGWNTSIDPRGLLQNFMANVWNVYGAAGSAVDPTGARTGTSIDPNSTVSYGLDMWGRRVGVSRVVNMPNLEYAWLGFAEAGKISDTAGPQPFGQAGMFPGDFPNENITLTNAQYLSVILAKAAANISGCSIPAINKILYNLFNAPGQPYAGYSSYCLDLGNMNMVYYFKFLLTPIDLAILVNSGILQRPSGVAAQIWQLDPPNTFGFASGFQTFSDGVSGFPYPTAGYGVFESSVYSPIR